MARSAPLPKKNTYISGGVDINTAPVNIAVVDCYISSIRLSNNAATATTFTLIDKSAGLNRQYDAVSLAADSISNEQFPEEQELYCAGGFDIQTSQAGVEAVIIYWTKP